MTSPGRTSIGFFDKFGGGAKRESESASVPFVGDGADLASAGASVDTSASGGIGGSGRGGAASARPVRARAASTKRCVATMRKGMRCFKATGHFTRESALPVVESRHVSSRLELAAVVTPVHAATCSPQRGSLSQSATRSGARRSGRDSKPSVRDRARTRSPRGR